MTLPPFPVDEITLDLITAALNPPPEAERTSLDDLLVFLSAMGGSDVDAIESSERIGGLPDMADDLIEDDPYSIEIVHLRDPQYHWTDVIRALVAEVKQLRGTA